jgi:hypothetical protein
MKPGGFRPLEIEDRWVFLPPWATLASGLQSDWEVSTGVHNANIERNHEVRFSVGQKVQEFLISDFTVGFSPSMDGGMSSGMSPVSESQFSTAVGMTRPLPLRVEHAQAGVLAEGEIDRPYALIGSDPECEITLNDPALPAHIACLQVFDDRIILVPFDTLQPFALSVEHPWQLGDYRVLRTDSDLTEPWGADPLQTHLPDGPKITLRLRTNHGPAATWSITRRMTFLGGSPACGIRLDHEGVSPVHAYLVATESGLWVVDLLSKSGVAVNGVAARTARLNDGDELEFGACRLSCHIDLWGEIPVAGMPEPAEEGELVPLAPVSTTPITFDIPPNADPATVALFQYVTAMQGHMMEHFRQSVEAMMADFGRMQREQMEETRRELNRMAELNAELHTLYRKVKESDPSPARPLYQPTPEFDPSADDDPSIRYQWVASRIAVMEAERTGIWNRLKGLFGIGTPKEL